MDGSLGATVAAYYHLVIDLLTSGSGWLLILMVAIVGLGSMSLRGSDSRVREAGKQAELELLCR